jgi:hypothetical protein
MNSLPKYLFIGIAALASLAAKGQQKPAQTTPSANAQTSVKKSTLTAHVVKPNYDTGSSNVSEADIELDLETDKAGNITGTMKMVDRARQHSTPTIISTSVEGRQERDEHKRKRIILKTVKLDSAKSRVGNEISGRKIPYDAVLSIVETGADYFEGSIRYVSNKAFTSDYKGATIDNLKADRYNPLLTTSITAKFRKTNKLAELAPLPEQRKPGSDTGIGYDDDIKKAKRDSIAAVVKQQMDSLAAVKKQDSIAAATTAVQVKERKKLEEFFSVNFKLGSSNEIRTPEDEETIFEIARIMREDPNIDLILVGQSENTEHKKIAKQRAENLADVLHDKYDINKKRIIPIEQKIKDKTSSDDIIDNAARVIGAWKLN